MRSKPWYAPEFRDWSDIGPGVSKATLNERVPELSVAFDSRVREQATE